MATLGRGGAFARACVLGLILVPGAAWAQQRGTVTGRVTDQATGQPLVSVQVYVVGTQLGRLTDQQGRYVIAGVPSGQREVRATILGYSQLSQSVAVSAGGTATADFALRESAVQLGGIVVNAVTGEEVARRALGNAVGSIDMAGVEKAAITRPADILTARIPGVEVRNINGTTGTGQRIRIRGANSISLSNEPLIIVDGVRFDNGIDFMDSGFSEGAPDQVPNRLNDLNPDDIESIEILKGPAASGVYGTAASNGVILIRTKRGASGPARWSVYSEMGTLADKNAYPDNIASLARRTNGTFAHCHNYEKAAGSCAQDSTAVFNPFTDADYTPFRTGSRQKYGLSVGGGGDQVTYFLSGDMENEDGVYASNFVKKYNLRGNMRALVRSNLAVNVSTSYTSSDFAQPGNDNSVMSPILNGMLGRALFNRTTPNRAYYSFNPEVTAEKYFATQGIERAVAALTSSWQPLSWLTVNGTAGIDVYSLNDGQLLEPNVAPIAETWVNGWAEESRGTNYNYTGNLAGVAKFQLTPAIVSTTTLGGDYTRNRFGATRGKGFGITPGTGSLDGTSSLFEVDEDNTEVITVGALVQQQFGFNDRVFLSAALRADDNSAFGKDFGLIYYPSLTGSWVINEEAFFPRSNVLTSLRLRGALGESGQRPQFRQSETYYSPATATTEGGDQPGITIGGAGNFDLKPERTREFEAGFDAGFLNERLAAEVTYFKRMTRDALIARNLPPSLGQSNPATPGTSGTRFENIGEVQNSGFELALNARIIDTRSVGWTLRVAGATLKNEIVLLGEGIDPILVNRGMQKHVQGYSAGSFWQAPITINDANNDGLLSLTEYAVGDTAEYIGPSLPTWMASLNSEIKIFDFLRVSALFEGRGGHFQHNSTEDFRCFFSAVTADRGCAGLDNPNATPQEQAAGLASVFGDPNTANVSNGGHVYKADFVKLRELAFTLMPPRSVLQRLGGRVSNLSLTIAGRNLRTWTDYPGLDPEINETGSSSNFSQGEFGTQPPVRYWTARINVTF